MEISEKLISFCLEYDKYFGHPPIEIVVTRDDFFRLQSEYLFNGIFLGGKGLGHEFKINGPFGEVSVTYRPLSHIPKNTLGKGLFDTED